MDESATRHFAARMDGFQDECRRQINGLRCRIEAIRARTRAALRRRATELDNIYENQVPIEVFLASARNEVVARTMLERRVAELRCENDQLREQIYLLQLQLEPLLRLPLAVQQLRDEVGDLARTIFTERVVNAARPSSSRSV